MSRDVRRKFIIGLLSLFIFVAGCGKTENAIPAASSTPTSVSSDSIAADGPFEWPEAKPAEAGIDEAKLQKIDEAVATKHKKTLSVLIVKDGRLVYERYYQQIGRASCRERVL